MCEDSELWEQMPQWLWTAAWWRRNARALRCPSHPSTLLDSSQRSCGVTLITERWQPTAARWAQVNSWKTSAAGAGKSTRLDAAAWCVSSAAGETWQSHTTSLGVKGHVEEIRTDRSQANDATFSRPHQQKTAGREMQTCNASTPQHRKYVDLKE